MDRCDKGQGLRGLAELREEIDRWRRTRVKAGRMPEALWQAAARLAEKHGVNRVASPLGLDYYGLKRRLEVERERVRAVVTSPTFVDLRAGAVRSAPPSAPLASVLELEKPDGEKLTLRFWSPLDAMAIMESFCRS
jgi:hypothetical protein